MQEASMKRLLLALALVLCVAGTSFASGYLGPAEPIAPVGKFSLGLGYFYYDDQFKKSGIQNDLHQNQLYLEGSWGFAKGWEGYLRIGGADARFTNADNDFNFNDTMKFYTGVGVRGVLYRFSPQFSLGTNLYVDYIWQAFKDTQQASTYITSNNQTYLLGAEATTKASNMWSGTAAFYGQWTPVKEVVVYGGPKFYYQQFKADITAGSASLNGTGVPVDLGDSETMTGKSWIGGVLGAGITVPQTNNRLKFGVEWQFSTRSSIGGQISYAF